ncbi:phage tail tip lysozyme [Staphylococcus sp. ACRSN]|uniref:phage tail tip lysozyme n=1 Tax=Staphylococcus sp. ACRSN TaxID=2918214 RepID=UPI001EF34835|nr:phage tail tip lysozyme [Staphylococcus sp. ACRSN]MCG7340151.1 phage tail tip lysozyme [Staphylococcus sp. ACRSN]
MSKKRDFEYSGRLENEKEKQPSPNEQPSQGSSNSNNLNDKDNVNRNNQEPSPKVQQTEDDLKDQDNRYSPQEEGNERPEQGNVEPKQTNEDVNEDNEGQPNQDGEEAQRNQGDSESSEADDKDFGNEQDDGDDNQSDQDFGNEGDDSQESESSNANDVQDDSGESDKDNIDDESENDKPDQSDDEKDDEPKQASEDHDIDDNSLKGKALGKIDPSLQKASKLKDLSKMNKEQAKDELIEITKSMAKKKITAAVVTYIAPVILPILGALLIAILLVFMIMGASNLMNDNKPEDEGCSVQDKASTNVKNSKDAKKNIETIYKYTKENVKGSTRKGIASWLGNINEESGGTFSSSTIQGGNEYKESLAKDPSAGGYAFGFAQLDSERRVNLIKYADKKDKKWSDMDLQLDYILNHDGTDSDLIKKLLKRDGDIKTITADIMNDWERAGAKESLPKRQAAASKYYSMLGDKDDSNIGQSTDSAGDNSDAGSNSGCNDDSNSKVDGELGASTKANGGSGKVLKQWKSKKDIPEKYKKHIQLPDYKGEKLNSSENIFPSTGNKGQCTELLFSYMSQLWKGKQPTNGNGNVIYKAYKSQGAKTTSNPTVGYGFSSNPPFAGATTSDVGHTGVVIGVMEDGKWLMSNYNLNGEANKDESRVETFALVDGNKKEGGATFFSGVGGAKIKSK